MRRARLLSIHVREQPGLTPYPDKSKGYPTMQAVLSRLINEEWGVQHAEEALLLALLVTALATAVAGLAEAIGASLTTSSGVVSGAPIP